MSDKELLRDFSVLLLSLLYLLFFIVCFLWFSELVVVFVVPPVAADALIKYN